MFQVKHLENSAVCSHIRMRWCGWSMTFFLYSSCMEEPLHSHFLTADDKTGFPARKHGLWLTDRARPKNTHLPNAFSPHARFAKYWAAPMVDGYHDRIATMCLHFHERNKYVVPYPNFTWRPLWWCNIFFSFYTSCTFIEGNAYHLEKHRNMNLTVEWQLFCHCPRQRSSEPVVTPVWRISDGHISECMPSVSCNERSILTSSEGI